MRYKFFFLFVFAFLILVSSQDVLASGSITVTRGANMPPITWSVGGAPGCTTDSSYLNGFGDGIYSQWTGFAPGTGSGVFSFTPGTRVYAPSGSYTFSCTAGATTDTATLIVNDCPGGTTWNATTHVCEAPAPPAPTLTLSASPASLAFGGGTTRVTWVTTGATFCDAWNGDASWDSYNPAAGGGFSDRVISGTTTFAMQCWNIASVSDGVKSVTVTVAPAPSATVSASPSTCTIAANQSTCTVPVTWNIANATTPNLYNLTRNVTYSNSATGSNVASAITNGNNTIQARDGASVLSVVVAVGSCAGGTTWDGGKCASDPTLSFSASPLNLPSGGGNTTLTWTPSGATWCWSTNWNGGSKWETSANGTWTSVQNIVSSTTFQLQCGNTLTGKSTSVLTATVMVAAAAPPDATVSMTVAPNPINEGESTTLTWGTTNASSCWGSGGNPGWDGPKNPAGGSEVITPSFPAMPYDIECWNATGGSVGPWSVSVSLIPAGPPANVMLNAMPPSVMIGDSTTLNWTANNATSCTASDGWNGSRDNISGSEVVTPLVNTTYTIQCWNSIGQSMGPRSMMVNVMVPPAAGVWLNANPPMITAGDPVNLDWFTMSNPTSCLASDGWGGPKSTLGGTETVYPVANTTYTIECWNVGGSMGPQSVSVMVSPPAATATVSANPLTCTIPQNQGTCTVDFTWNISNAGSPNLFNFTTGSIYSNSPSGNSVAYPITHGMNRIEAREGGIPIMGADVTVNGFCGALDIWDGMTSTCISAGCTQTVFCTDYTTEVGNTCQGADYSFTDNCGDAHLCPGTRTCNYNWKEIAP